MRSEGAKNKANWRSRYDGEIHDHTGRSEFIGTTEEDDTINNETMREKVMRRSLTNPRIKLAKPSGEGLVIVGAKP